jgi:hypothetical protein
VGSDQIVRAEEALAIEEMVDRATAAAVVENLRFPVLEYPAGRSV